ncbi:DUF1642 domain-containing protein [Lacticaseibacillus paracasei]|uniref:DUF1642 domain-containing protein n=1 Tax=Lacticaseibacillus paracasei TaxID=1597 RepID=UPI004045D31A
MSEEKLYAIKNDDGKYWDFEDQDGFWELNTVGLAAIAGEEDAKCVANDHGGHVVTFVEESKKVVLSEEQAQIVEDANKYKFPASYISMNTDDYDGLEKLLMNAYVNGYTVAKEKKYNVKVPHTKEGWYYKSGDSDLLAICPADKKLRGKFTESEIEHYNLQDCEKEEVTDDGIR